MLEVQGLLHAASRSLRYVVDICQCYRAVGLVSMTPCAAGHLIISTQY